MNHPNTLLPLKKGKARANIPSSPLKKGGGRFFGLRNKGWVAKFLGLREGDQSSHFKILKWGSVLVEKIRTPES